MVVVKSIARASKGCKSSCSSNTAVSCCSVYVVWSHTNTHTQSNINFKRNPPEIRHTNTFMIILQKAYIRNGQYKKKVRISSSRAYYFFAFVYPSLTLALFLSLAFLLASDRVRIICNRCSIGANIHNNYYTTTQIMRLWNVRANMVNIISFYFALTLRSF